MSSARTDGYWKRSEPGCLGPATPDRRQGRGWVDFRPALGVGRADDVQGKNENRPRVYLDTSAVNWFLDHPAAVQSLTSRCLFLTNQYVAIELGATRCPARRTALFDLLASFVEKEDGLLANPTVVMVELTKQFYREGWNASINIAEPSSSFIWHYIEHPGEAAKEEFRRQCQAEKDSIEQRSLDFVRGAFNLKKQFLPSPTWKDELLQLVAYFDRLVSLIVEPFISIVETEIVSDAPSNRTSGQEQSLFATKGKALQEQWFKIPLLCSFSACWLRFFYEVLKASEQPVPSAKWRKMATDLLQGIHLAQARVEWFLSNDGEQKKLLEDVAYAIPRVCPSVAAAKVMHPEGWINLGC